MNTQSLLLRHGLLLAILVSPLTSETVEVGTRGWRAGNHSNNGNYLLFPQKPLSPCGPLWPENTTFSVYERKESTLFWLMFNKLLGSSPGDKIKITGVNTSSVDGWTIGIEKVEIPASKLVVTLDESGALSMTTKGITYKRNDNPPLFDMLLGIQINDSPTAVEKVWTSNELLVYSYIQNTFSTTEPPTRNQAWRKEAETSTTVLLTNNAKMPDLPRVELGSSETGKPLFTFFFPQQAPFEWTNYIETRLSLAAVGPVGMLQSNFLYSNEIIRQIKSFTRYTKLESTDKGMRLEYSPMVAGKDDPVPTNCITNFVTNGSVVTMVVTVVTNLVIDGTYQPLAEGTFLSPKFSVYQRENPSWYGLALSVIGACSTPGSGNDFEVDLESERRGELVFGSLGHFAKFHNPTTNFHLAFSKEGLFNGNSTLEIRGESLRPDGGAFGFDFTPQFDPSDSSIDLTLCESILDLGLYKGDAKVTIKYKGGQGLLVSVFSKTAGLVPLGKLGLVRGQKKHIGISWESDPNVPGDGKVFVFANGYPVATLALEINHFAITGPRSFSNGFKVAAGNACRSWPNFYNRAFPFIPKVVYREVNFEKFSWRGSWEPVFYNVEGPDGEFSEGMSNALLVTGAPPRLTNLNGTGGDTFYVPEDLAAIFDQEITVWGKSLPLLYDVDPYDPYILRDPDPSSSLQVSIPMIHNYYIYQIPRLYQNRTFEIHLPLDPSLQNLPLPSDWPMQVKEDRDYDPSEFKAREPITKVVGLVFYSSDKYQISRAQIYDGFKPDFRDYNASWAGDISLVTPENTPLPQPEAKKYFTIGAGGFPEWMPFGTIKNQAVGVGPRGSYLTVNGEETCNGNTLFLLLNQSYP